MYNLQYRKIVIPLRRSNFYLLYTWRKKGYHLQVLYGKQFKECIELDTPLLPSPIPQITIDVDTIVNETNTEKLKEKLYYCS